MMHTYPILGYGRDPPYSYGQNGNIALVGSFWAKYLLLEGPIFPKSLPIMWPSLVKLGEIKGIVHLNIIFSYMKFKKICNVDNPVY